MTDLMTAPPQTVSILEDLAHTFIDIHLDNHAKRDLAVWFAEHPKGQFQTSKLARVLGHDRTTIETGLRGLREAAVIAPAGTDDQPTWRLTTHPASRQILGAVARCVREHTYTPTRAG